MTAFDDTYQKFLRRDQSNAELKSMANLTLQAAIDADISYNFLGGLTEKRYVDAKKALALAQEKFAVSLGAKARNTTPDLEADIANPNEKRARRSVQRHREMGGGSGLFIFPAKIRGIVH